MANTVSIGNAGEYFVAGELERRGFSVAVPMSNVKDFDILAFNRNSGKQYAIQVKTTEYKKKEWTLVKKAESLSADNIIYVFVSLCGMEPPEYHIVPSETVAKTVKKNHNAWLSAPGKRGQKHNDNDMRKIL